MRFMRRWQAPVGLLLALVLIGWPLPVRAANVTSTGSVTIQFSQIPATGALANVPLPMSEALRSVLTNGTAADKVDGLYFTTLTFVASTPQTLDLTTLTDVLTASITNVRVRFIAIKVKWTTDNVPLLVSPGVTNGWTGFLATGSVMSVFPSSSNNDGFFVLQAPQTTGIVVDSTHKTMTLNPQTAAGTVDVIIATCSA